MITNLQFKIKKPIDVVFDYLSNMQKFVSVHPVIHKIENVSANNYKVHETLKFGAIPFSFTYPVNIECNFENKSICIKATVFKLNKIKMDFILTQENECTIISEDIHFATPLPLKWLMKKIFKTQHALLFKNIELV